MSEPTRLESGQKAPAFSTIDGEGNEQILQSLCAQGRTVVLYFYPKDDTPGCTIQACDFRDDMSSLVGNGVTVLGISKDDQASHGRFTAKYGLNFPLLMDEDLAIHKAYGVWQEKKNYGRTYMGTVRSTFIIEPDGLIKEAMYNVRSKGHSQRVKGILDLE